MTGAFELDSCVFYNSVKKSTIKSLLYLYSRYCRNRFDKLEDMTQDKANECFQDFFFELSMALKEEISSKKKELFSQNDKLGGRGV